MQKSDVICVELEELEYILPFVMRITVPFTGKSHDLFLVSSSLFVLWGEPFLLVSGGKVG